MARKQPPDEDSPLLSDAEAQYGERQADLVAALRASRCGLHEATAALTLFAKGGGTSVPVEIGYDELAHTLWCSYATARRTIDRLVQLGIFQPRASAQRSGHRGKNRYVYDAHVVRSIRLGRPLPAALMHAPAVGGVSALPAQSEQTPAQSEQTPAQEKSRRMKSEEEDLFLEPNQETPPLHSLLPAHFEHPAQFANTEFANGATSAKGIPSSRPAPVRASALADRVTTADASADADLAGQRESWLQAERMLRAAGLRGVEKAISQARDRGVPPEAIAELVEFYRAHRGSWDADLATDVGVLFPAIRAWHPGAKAGDLDEAGHWLLWPTARRRHAVVQQRDVAGQRRAADDRLAAERQAEAAAAAQREAQFGPRLDAMSAAQRDELLGQSSIAKYLRGCPPNDPAVRAQLLNLLEGRDANL